MIVRCDKCGCGFSPNVLSRKLKDGVIVQYFVCDQCGTEFIASVTDAALRQDISKVVRMRGTISRRKAQGKPVSEAYTERIQDLLSRNKKRGKELREQYQGGKWP